LITKTLIISNGFGDKTDESVRVKILKIWAVGAGGDKCPTLLAKFYSYW